MRPGDARTKVGDIVIYKGKHGASGDKCWAESHGLFPGEFCRVTGVDYCTWRTMLRLNIEEDTWFNSLLFDVVEPK